MSQVLPALALLLAATAVPVPAASTDALEALLAAPYVTRLVAAPEVDRIAFVVEEAGVRNVYTAAAPGFEPRALTADAADDGQVISALALTPDGKQAVYVRGGGPNRSGEYPNPASSATGITPRLYSVPTSGAATPRLIAEEALGATVSPDGRMVLFTRSGQIHGAALTAARDSDTTSGTAAAAGPDTAGAGDAGAAVTAQPLFRARGNNGNPRFSPDGSRVVFTSDRGDHAFIGVYHLERGTIRWIAPDVDRDYAPVWSPDGTRIAFFRRPGARRGEVPDITASWPYALWIADADGGAAHERWRAPADGGGFAHYYPATPLRWTDADRLVFYSEHDDWLHLYALAPDGDAPPIDLTPGDGEAESSVLSRDGRTLFFAGNFDDPDSRNLYRVPVAGGQRRRLTDSDSIDTDPVALTRHLLWRAGTASRPQTVAVASLAGAERRRLYPGRLPDAYPEALLTAPQVVTFEAADGVTVHATLFEPRDGAGPGDEAAARSRPALIFMHGGPIRQMLPGFHYRGYYAKAYAMNQYLASIGYVVLAVNYRAGIGYGRAFRQAPGQGPRGATEYRDILAAAAWLQSRPAVDHERIGLWGGSYGGYLTALGLARDSHLFRAGVDLHGVHDWSFRATDFGPGGYWGLAGEAALDLAVASSPVADVSFWTSPVLMIHGDDDRNVLFAQTTDLVQRLRARDVTVETLVFPDEVHGFLRHASWLAAYRATADFFDRHLAAGAGATGDE